MAKSEIFKVLSLLFTITFFSSCECSNTSSSYHNYSNPYNNHSQPNTYRNYNQPSKSQNVSLSKEQIENLLKQLEMSPHPAQRHKVQRSDDWNRGYEYGWDLGYQDAIDGNGGWASYNDSGKGGEFLDGYESGYVDGYESGKSDRDDKGKGIEDL